MPLTAALFSRRGSVVDARVYLDAPAACKEGDAAASAAASLAGDPPRGRTPLRRIPTPPPGRCSAPAARRWRLRFVNDHTCRNDSLVTHRGSIVRGSFSKSVTAPAASFVLIRGAGAAVPAAAARAAVAKAEAAERDILPADLSTRVAGASAPGTDGKQRRGKLSARLLTGFAGFAAAIGACAAPMSVAGVTGTVNNEMWLATPMLPTGVLLH